MNLIFCLAAIGIGLITGGLTSLIGASGGLVLVPVLTMLFNIDVHTAIGTSLFVDVIVSITVAYSYFKNGNIEFKSGLWIALTSIIGAQLGVLFASKMAAGNLSSIFGILLVVVGTSMIRKSLKEQSDSDLSNGVSKHIRFSKEWQRILAALITGLGIGIISGIFGAGGGVMILLALIIIMSFPLHKAIGTSTLIMAITALSSTIGYAARGKIDYEIGAFLILGAVVGGILGSRYANKVNEKTLKKVVGICFAVMGVVMVTVEIIK